MPRRRALWARGLDELRSLTPGTRVVLGSVVALVVIGALWLAVRDGSGRRVRLIETERFSAEQLSAIRAAFESAGLHDYSVKSGHIEVPREESARYLAALAQEPDLPYRFFEEVLQRRDWFTSRGDLDRQWDLATQQFLAQIIREMDGVEKAWVRWASAAKPGLRGGEDVRASVGVKMVAGHTLSRRIEEAIKELMVGSRAGLSSENVSVVDLSELAHDGAGAAHAVAEPLGHIRQLERHYAEKIEKLLAFIEGVVVSVDVTLSSLDDASAAPVQGERDLQAAVAVGVGHAAAQGDAPAKSPPIVASQSAVMLHATDGNSPGSASSRTPRRSVRSDLRPVRIAVTVGLPDEYFVRRAQGQGRGAAAATNPHDENERIRRLVVAALPTLEEPVRVSLHRYRKREAAAESGIATWIDFGGIPGVQYAVAFVLLTAALLILAVRSALLKRKLQRIGPGEAGTGPAVAQAPHRRALGSEVQSMVHRDAARAAQVLKGWIHEGEQA